MQSRFVRSRRLGRVHYLAVAYLTISLLFPVPAVLAGPVSEAVRGTVDLARDYLAGFSDLFLGFAQDDAQAEAASTGDASLRVTHFRLCPRRVLLYSEETFTLSPTPLGAEDEIVDFAYLEWWSENPGVATVSSWGEVTAVSPGQTFVVVQSGSAQARILVQVREGYRPYQTDEEWDEEHQDDCSEPEATASLNDTQDRALATTSDGGELPRSWVRRAVARVASGTGAARPAVVPAALMEVESAMSVEPDAEDTYAYDAVSNENGVGTPRNVSMKVRRPPAKFIVEADPNLTADRRPVSAG
jgi:hypothetical protein